jgi:hypothetical protein
MSSAPALSPLDRDQQLAPRFDADLTHPSECIRHR